MAAALFAECAGEATGRLNIGSAGVAALVGRPPAADVIDLMRDRGIDVSGHRARQLTASLALQYELLLVMERGHKRHIESNWPAVASRVHLLGEWRGEEVADPYGLPQMFYAKCMRQIESCIADWQTHLFE